MLVSPLKRKKERKKDLLTNNNLGLQAIHMAVGYIMLWFAFTVGFTVFQFKEFWEFVWSFKGVLFAFLIGVPFVSKMLTKLYPFYLLWQIIFF